MGTGFQLSILTKSYDVMCDWLTSIHPFPDTFTLTNEVNSFWSDAQTKSHFHNFVDATPPSNDQVSYPQ